MKRRKGVEFPAFDPEKHTPIFTSDRLDEAMDHFAAYGKITMLIDETFIKPEDIVITATQGEHKGKSWRVVDGQWKTTDT